MPTPDKLKEGTPVIDAELKFEQFKTFNDFNEKTERKYQTAYQDLLETYLEAGSDAEPITAARLEQQVAVEMNMNTVAWKNTEEGPDFGKSGAEQWLEAAVAYEDLKMDDLISPPTEMNLNLPIEPESLGLLTKQFDGYLTEAKLTLKNIPDEEKYTFLQKKMYGAVNELAIDLSRKKIEMEKERKDPDMVERMTLLIEDRYRVGLLLGVNDWKAGQEKAEQDVKALFALPQADIDYLIENRNKILRTPEDTERFVHHVSSFNNYAKENKLRPIFPTNKAVAWLPSELGWGLPDLEDVIALQNGIQKRALEMMAEEQPADLLENQPQSKARLLPIYVVKAEQELMLQASKTTGTSTEDERIRYKAQAALSQTKEENKFEIEEFVNMMEPTNREYAYPKLIKFIEEISQGRRDYYDDIESIRNMATAIDDNGSYDKAKADPKFEKLFLDNKIASYDDLVEMTKEVFEKHYVPMMAKQQIFDNMASDPRWLNKTSSLRLNPEEEWEQLAVLNLKFMFDPSGNTDSKAIKRLDEDVGLSLIPEELVAQGISINPSPGGGQFRQIINDFHAGGTKKRKADEVVSGERSPDELSIDNQLKRTEIAETKVKYLDLAIEGEERIQQLIDSLPDPNQYPKTYTDLVELITYSKRLVDNFTPEQLQLKKEKAEASLKGLEKFKKGDEFLRKAVTGGVGSDFMDFTKSMPYVGRIAQTLEGGFDPLIVDINDELTELINDGLTYTQIEKRILNTDYGQYVKPYLESGSSIEEVIEHFDLIKDVANQALPSAYMERPQVLITGKAFVALGSLGAIQNDVIYKNKTVKDLPPQFAKYFQTDDENELISDIIKSGRASEDVFIEASNVAGISNQLSVMPALQATLAPLLTETYYGSGVLHQKESGWTPTMKALEVAELAIESLFTDTAFDVPGVVWSDVLGGGADSFTDYLSNDKKNLIDKYTYAGEFLSVEAQDEAIQHYDFIFKDQITFKKAWDDYESAIIDSYIKEYENASPGGNASQRREYEEKRKKAELGKDNILTNKDVQDFVLQYAKFYMVDSEKDPEKKNAGLQWYNKMEKNGYLNIYNLFSRATISTMTGGMDKMNAMVDPLKGIAYAIPAVITSPATGGATIPIAVTRFIQGSTPTGSAMDRQYSSLNPNYVNVRNHDLSAYQSIIYGLESEFTGGHIALGQHISISDGYGTGEVKSNYFNYAMVQSILGDPESAVVRSIYAPLKVVGKTGLITNANKHMLKNTNNTLFQNVKDLAAVSALTAAEETKIFKPLANKIIDSKISKAETKKNISQGGVDTPVDVGRKRLEIYRAIEKAPEADVRKLNLLFSSVGASALGFAMMGTPGAWMNALINNPALIDAMNVFTAKMAKKAGFGDTLDKSNMYGAISIQDSMKNLEYLRQLRSEELGHNILLPIYTAPNPASVGGKTVNTSREVYVNMLHTLGKTEADALNAFQDIATLTSATKKEIIQAMMFKNEGALANLRERATKQGLNPDMFSTLDDVIEGSVEYKRLVKDYVAANPLEDAYNTDYQLASMRLAAIIKSEGNADKALSFLDKITFETPKEGFGRLDFSTGDKFFETNAKAMSYSEESILKAAGVESDGFKSVEQLDSFLASKKYIILKNKEGSFEIVNLYGLKNPVDAAVNIKRSTAGVEIGEIKVIPSGDAFDPTTRFLVMQAIIQEGMKEGYTKFTWDIDVIFKEAIDATPEDKALFLSKVTEYTESFRTNKKNPVTNSVQIHKPFVKSYRESKKLNRTIVPNEPIKKADFDESLVFPESLKTAEDLALLRAKIALAKKESKNQATINEKAKLLNTTEILAQLENVTTQKELDEFLKKYWFLKTDVNKIKDKLNPAEITAQPEITTQIKPNAETLNAELKTLQKKLDEAKVEENKPALKLEEDQKANKAEIADLQAKLKNLAPNAVKKISEELISKIEDNLQSQTKKLNKSLDKAADKVEVELSKIDKEIINVQQEINVLAKEQLAQQAKDSEQDPTFAKTKEINKKRAEKVKEEAALNESKKELKTSIPINKLISYAETLENLDVNEIKSRLSKVATIEDLNAAVEGLELVVSKRTKKEINDLNKNIKNEKIKIEEEIENKSLALEIFADFSDDVPNKSIKLQEDLIAKQSEIDALPKEIDALPETPKKEKVPLKEEEIKEIVQEIKPKIDNALIKHKERQEVLLEEKEKAIPNLGRSFNEAWPTSIYRGWGDSERIINDVLLSEYKLGDKKVIVLEATENAAEISRKKFNGVAKAEALAAEKFRKAQDLRNQEADFKPTTLVELKPFEKFFGEEGADVKVASRGSEVVDAAWKDLDAKTKTSTSSYTPKETLSQIIQDYDILAAPKKKPEYGVMIEKELQAQKISYNKVTSKTPNGEEIDLFTIQRKGDSFETSEFSKNLKENKIVFNKGDTPLSFAANNFGILERILTEDEFLLLTRDLDVRVQDDFVFLTIEGKEQFTTNIDRIRNGGAVPDPQAQFLYEKVRVAFTELLLEKGRVNAGRYNPIPMTKFETEFAEYFNLAGTIDRNVTDLANQFIIKEMEFLKSELNVSISPNLLDGLLKSSQEQGVSFQSLFDKNATIKLNEEGMIRTVENLEAKAAAKQRNQVSDLTNSETLMDLRPSKYMNVFSETNLKPERARATQNKAIQILEERGIPKTEENIKNLIDSEQILISPDDIDQAFFQLAKEGEKIDFPDLISRMLQYVEYRNMQKDIKAKYSALTQNTFVRSDLVTNYKIAARNKQMEIFGVDSYEALHRPFKEINTKIDPRLTLAEIARELTPYQIIEDPKIIARLRSFVDQTKSTPGIKPLNGNLEVRIVNGSPLRLHKYDLEEINDILLDMSAPLGSRRAGILAAKDERPVWGIITSFANIFKGKVPGADWIAKKIGKAIDIVFENYNPLKKDVLDTLGAEKNPHIEAAVNRFNNRSRNLGPDIEFLLYNLIEQDSLEFLKMSEDMTDGVTLKIQKRLEKQKAADKYQTVEDRDILMNLPFIGSKGRLNPVSKKWTRQQLRNLSPSMQHLGRLIPNLLNFKVDPIYIGKMQLRRVANEFFKNGETTTIKRINKADPAETVRSRLVEIENVLDDDTIKSQIDIVRNSLDSGPRDKSVNAAFDKINKAIDDQSSRVNPMDFDSWRGPLKSDYAQILSAEHMTTNEAAAFIDLDVILQKYPSIKNTKQKLSLEDQQTMQRAVSTILDGAENRYQHVVEKGKTIYGSVVGKRELGTEGIPDDVAIRAYTLFYQGKINIGNVDMKRILNSKRFSATEPPNTDLGYWTLNDVTKIFRQYGFKGQASQAESVLKSPKSPYKLDMKIVKAGGKEADIHLSGVANRIAIGSPKGYSDTLFELAIDRGDMAIPNKSYRGMDNTKVMIEMMVRMVNDEILQDFYTDIANIHVFGDIQKTSIEESIQKGLDPLTNRKELIDETVKLINSFVANTEAEIKYFNDFVTRPAKSDLERAAGDIASEIINKYNLKAGGNNKHEIVTSPSGEKVIISTEIKDEVLQYRDDVSPMGKAKDDDLISYRDYREKIDNGRRLRYALEQSSLITEHLVLELKKTGVPKDDAKSIVRLFMAGQNPEFELKEMIDKLGYEYDKMYRNLSEGMDAKAKERLKEEVASNYGRKLKNIYGLRDPISATDKHRFFLNAKYEIAEAIMLKDRLEKVEAHEKAKKAEKIAEAKDLGLSKRKIKKIEKEKGSMYLTPSLESKLSTVDSMTIALANYFEAVTIAGTKGNAAMNVWSALNTAKKKSVTTGLLLPTIAYYFNNMFGALFQAYNAGGLEGITSSFAIAAENQAVFRESLSLLYGQASSSTSTKVFTTKYGDSFTAHQLATLMRQEGVSSSFIKVELATSISDDIRKNAQKDWISLQAAYSFPGAWQNQLAEMATLSDNVFRLATFMDRLNQGFSPADAAKFTKDAFFDYAALLPSEKKVLREVFLFYAFMRKNQIQVFRTLRDDPQRIINQMKYIQATQDRALEDEGREFLPQYMKTRLMSTASAPKWGNSQQRNYFNNRFETGVFVMPMIGTADGLSLIAPMANTAIETARYVLGYSIGLRPAGEDGSGLRVDGRYFEIRNDSTSQPLKTALKEAQTLGKFVGGQLSFFPKSIIESARGEQFFGERKFEYMELTQSHLDSLQGIADFAGWGELFNIEGEGESGLTTINLIRDLTPYEGNSPRKDEIKYKFKDGGDLFKYLILMEAAVTTPGFGIAGSALVGRAGRNNQIKLDWANALLYDEEYPLPPGTTLEDQLLTMIGLRYKIMPTTEESKNRLMNRYFKDFVEESKQLKQTLPKPQ